VTAENQNYHEVVLPLLYIKLPWSHLWPHVVTSLLLR